MNDKQNYVLMSGLISQNQQLQYENIELKQRWLYLKQIFINSIEHDDLDTVTKRIYESIVDEMEKIERGTNEINR